MSKQGVETGREEAKAGKMPGGLFTSLLKLLLSNYASAVYSQDFSKHLFSQDG